MAAKIETETERYDPMKDFVTVTLPRATGKEENFVFVGLNGKGYKIIKGKPVRVPRPVYDILMESVRMQERQDRWNDQQDERTSRMALNGAG